MPRLSRYTFAGLACSGFASRQILSAAAEGLHVLVGSGPSVVAEPEKSAGASKPSRARAASRTEERRVGKEWVSTCRSRGSPENLKKNKRSILSNTQRKR